MATNRASAFRGDSGKAPMTPRRKEKDMSKPKNWIAGAIKHPGALRKELGAKKGDPIPAKKLAAAAKKPGVVGKRARLAQTLKKMHK